MHTAWVLIRALRAPHALELRALCPLALRTPHALKLRALRPLALRAPHALELRALIPQKLKIWLKKSSRFARHMRLNFARFARLDLKN